MDNRQAVLDAERAKILDVAEAAFVLRVTKATVLKMCRSQALPHWREGRVIRIHLDSLTPQPQEVRHESSVPRTHSASEAQYEAQCRRFRAAHGR